VLAYGWQTILKGAWLGPTNHLNFVWAPTILLEWLIISGAVNSQSVCMYVSE